MAVLAPLGGPWSVFVFACIDAALIGVPLDLVVARYVHTDPHHAFLYTVMGALGSAIGSLVPYAIGYKGGEALLVKRIGQKKFSRIQGLSERYGDLALIIPSMMPPPTPFKLFVFSAGVLEMNWLHFMAAIFAGRLARFTILAALTIKFGQEILELIQRLANEHRGVLLAVIATIVLLIIVAKRMKKTDKSGVSSEDSAI